MVKRHVLEEVLFKFARQRQRSKWSSLQNQIGNSPALFSNQHRACPRFIIESTYFHSNQASPPPTKKTSIIDT